MLLQPPNPVTNGLPCVALWLSGQVHTKSLENIVADSLFPARRGLQDRGVGVEVPDDPQGLHVAGNTPTDDVILDH